MLNLNEEIASIKRDSNLAYRNQIEEEKQIIKETEGNFFPILLFVIGLATAILIFFIGIPIMIVVVGIPIMIIAAYWGNSRYTKNEDAKRQIDHLELLIVQNKQFIGYFSNGKNY